MAYFQAGLYQLDTLHVVFQRGHHGRELTRQRIGAYEDFLAVVGSGTAHRRAVDGLGGRCHSHLLLVGVERRGGFGHILHHVEAIKLVEWREHQLGLTDVVGAESEAHGLLTLDAATHHATSEVDQRLVNELQAGNLLVKGMGHVQIVGVGRVASGSCKRVAVLLDLDEVVADGHTHGEVTLCIGGDRLSVLRTELSVDIDVAVFHRVVGAGIAHVAAYGEGRGVFEVNTAIHQRRGADKA